MPGAPGHHIILECHSEACAAAVAPWLLKCQTMKGKSLRPEYSQGSSTLCCASHACLSPAVLCQQLCWSGVPCEDLPSPESHFMLLLIAAAI